MTTRNWADLGIAWVETMVSRRAGANDSDKRPLGFGPIPQLANTDLAVKAELDAAIMAGVNGTSWRVTAQDVIRAYLEAKHEVPLPRRDSLPVATDREDLKERIFARIKGMRTAALATVKVFVAPLPDGTKWEGTDATEYEQLYAAGLVDAGMDANLALGVAANVAGALKK